MTDTARTDAFITRWSAASGSERANYQLFVTELCDLLGTPKPDPASIDTRDNAYVFERRVEFAHGDGTQSFGFIDCYQRGRFVLEAKKLRAGAHTKGFDDALLRADSVAQQGPGDEQATRRLARLTARELKKDIFRHGKCTMRVGRKQITVLAKELADDPNFRTYQQALAQTIAASLRVVAQRAQAVGAPTIDVVLAGGGSHLPFLPALVQHAGNSVAPGIQLRIGSLSPSNPLYTSIDASLRDVFPQIAMAVGGALVEMMPAR